MERDWCGHSHRTWQQPSRRGGWQGGFCTNPPCSQLRASKDDCQREKEEKEKLKKLLKQHKQVRMGGKTLE